MKTKVTAHRGWREKYPENTLVAFKKAVEVGADRIEFDVHYSKDKKLVVRHDYNVSDANKNQFLIFEKDYESLKEIDQNIPVLDEVFSELGNKIEYEIELKGFSLGFLRSVLDLVGRHNLLSKIEFTSSSRSLLNQVKNIEVKAKTGMFVHPYPSWMSAKLGDSLLVAELELGKIDVAHCSPAILTKELVWLLRSKRKKIHASDCNSEEDIVKAFKLKVDQLSTDKLELALKIKKEIRD